MKYILFLFAASTFLFSCTKNASATNSDNDSNYVKGYVIVGIDSTTSLEKLFTNVNVLDISIEEISGYIFTTSIPEDSIAYINALLNSKPYIKINGFSSSVYADFSTLAVYNTSILWNMGLQNQTDYLKTLSTLRMKFVPNDFTDMVVKVPDGDEKAWLKKFKSYSWVSWAQLNYNNQIIIN